MSETTTEDLKFQIHILRPRKGDVLVVRLNENMTSAQIEVFMKSLQTNVSDYQGSFMLFLKGDQAQDAWVWPESKARELLRKAGE